MFLFDWVKGFFYFFTPELHDGDTQNGRGTLYHKNNNIKYQGYWKDGKYNGQGKLYTYDGLPIYDGSFKDGKYDGQGTLCEWEGKRTYTGGFKAGFKHGQGTEYRPYGDVSGSKSREGLYSGGNLVSGKMYDGDGEVMFEGRFLHGGPESGRLFLQDGTILEGKIYHRSQLGFSTSGSGMLTTPEGYKYRTVDGVPYGDKVLDTPLKDSL